VSHPVPQPALGDTPPPRFAPHGPVILHSLYVVAQSRLEVAEEDAPDELTAAAHSRLVEDALKVLLHGVRGDEELGGGLV